MDIAKIVGVGLIAIVIITILKQYKPEFSVYISLLTGVIILSLVLGKVQGIIEIIKNLSEKTALNNEFLILLLKVTGIAILTEYIVSVCNDSGENAIANKIDLGGKIIIMSLSIPIISGLLDTIIKILP